MFSWRSTLIVDSVWGVWHRVKCGCFGGTFEEHAVSITKVESYDGIRGQTIKLANSPPCAFFYIRGIVHYEFVPTGQTVIQAYYLEVLKRLRENVRWKRSEIFANNSWILHHDNALTHTALPVREILATKQITVLEHPAYSPDLAPSDFFLFPKIKEILKRRHFNDIGDIRINTTAALKAIPQNQFQNCFEGWNRRWHRCIAYQGEDIEGDHGCIQQWGM